MRFIVGEYEIDDDPGRVDARVATDFLTTRAYWGRWRGHEEIARQIREAWRVVGAYDGSGAMVGFARAIGDGASAYLADVFVLPAHRGAGLGKALVRGMIEEGPAPEARWMLHTADAHGLYREFGFAAPGARYLERPRAESPGTRGGGPAVRTPAATGSLVGEHVRLDPLGHRHVPALLAAGANGGDLYSWTSVPRDEAGMRRLVEAAVADRDRGGSVPFAVIRLEDEAVIGSTRFWNLTYWAWPEPRETPDTCEIGHTWLAKDAIRTAANTEMKRLMLTHAFGVWGVRSVCLHTDARNERSRAAIERIGARFEGILRAHRIGTALTPRDSARFSITAEEWPEVGRRLDRLRRRPA
jgi:RimJ/RimL family protein N-acetyltransferase/GNAT superfamily N-acetyltransferase